MTIDTKNFKALLKQLEFEQEGDIFRKSFNDNGSSLTVDFQKRELQYPESDGLKINERQICNFSHPENIVVFECVHKLLKKGYKPQHIELEPKWKVGHGTSGGRADILVKKQDDKPLLIIECKTYGREFNKAWQDTENDGGQLFSYAQQIAETEFLCLYASTFDVEADQLLVEQRIISHKDNDKILAEDKKLLSFKDASNVRERYEAWSQTYQQESTETGIFENNIQPYHIGKNNYTLDTDTREVTEQDKEGKYHRFRTILRQHNIARKETAFEVLVNLFLAKIVDEENNKGNLEFYWKGIAYDNYYDFIDRLQRLYQTGMREFLKDEVMYISNEQIDCAFWTVKNRRNATRKQIQKYFRDLKFFSNNAFSLINVHNERLFNRNTKVLVELVQMWQGLRLKSQEQNQFLGDLFEYFLDNSIKQSEGQFFTPMPITKFIVSSLPLEHKIQQSSEPLKAIDYACGAGHFLTEYAHQIKPLVETNKKIKLGKYYENIIGVEKEDRLAKIAKVSAYMYGQDQIKIIEEDALGDIAELTPERFDVLVANPPFAVEGFLRNLTDKQKENYELIKTAEANSNTNNIQCFFLERAKQLMTGNGAVGVIVPSSILSNSDSTHIATREIILKYFDIIALVELGSGTFGKTGTNTIVLFLRRKVQRPEPAEHYQNRVEDYFAGEGEQDQDEYQDGYLVEKYCEHNELPLDDYRKLFSATPETIGNIHELLKTELFTQYKKAFDHSTEIKNLKKQKAFKNKSRQDQALELNKHLIDYLKAIEKDKFLYFMLVFESPQKVLIVKSPDGNKQQKQFLGYEWSGAKGSEGIKYNGGSTVNDIITPLFNPKNSDDPTRINTLIRQNFLGQEPNDLSGFEQYQDLIRYARAEDILDFSRVGFNKAFSLTPKKNISIESKWPLVRVGSLFFINTKTYDPSMEPNKKFVYIDIDSVSKGSGRIDYQNVILGKDAPSRARRIAEKEDFIISSVRPNLKAFAYIDRDISDCIFSTGFFILNVKSKEENINKSFFHIFMDFGPVLEQMQLKMKKGQDPSINKSDLENILIPLPPKAIQEKIVTECGAIDRAVEQARQTVDQAKQEIDDKVQAVFNANYDRKKIKEVAKINPSKTELKNIDEETIVSFVEMASVSNDGFIQQKIDMPYKNLKKGSYTYFAENDIIIAKITPSMENGKCAYVTGLTNRIGMGSSEFHVLRVLDNLSPVFLFSLLNRENVRKEASTKMTGASGHRRVPVTYYENFIIPIPPMADQKVLVADVEQQEQTIRRAQAIIDRAPKQKQHILDKYLK